MRSAFVIDLDGTLLQTNTFRDYLSFCGRCAMLRFRWDLALCIVWWVMLRKLRVVSHSTMKRHLMQRTVLFMQRGGRMDDFVEEELLLVNPRAKAELERYRNRGYLLVMATAAPSFYAKALADDFSLDACLATPLPSEVVIGEWHENVGQEKASTVQRFLGQHNAKLDTVLTDHYDDIPLFCLNASGTNLLVNPSTATLKALHEQQIVARVI